jgi:hypothetical protein
MYKSHENAAVLLPLLLNNTILLDSNPPSPSSNRNSQFSFFKMKLSLALSLIALVPFTVAQDPSNGSQAMSPCLVRKTFPQT